MAYELTDEDRQLVSSMVQKQYGGFDGTASSALNFQKQQSAVALPKKKKNFWTDQISTGGGIGGALGGATLGASIGSVVPVVGTAVGGLLGALAGGALGSGGGEMVENAITGDDLMKNVGQEALLGGVTSLPIGAGLKLARAGVKAATGVGKTAAGELVEQAGLQTIPKKTVAKLVDGGKIAPETLDDVLKIGQATDLATKTSMAGKLNTKADNLLAQQYGPISKPTIRANNPTQTFGQLADVGITKPTDVERVAGAITGADGILNQQVARAVGSARNINTDGLRDVFTRTLDDFGVVDKDRKSLEAIFKAQIGKLNGGSSGTLNGATASDALSTMRSLESKIADLRGKGGNYRMTTPERSDMANVLQAVKSEIQDRLYTAAGANENMQALLTPALRKQLVNLMPNNTKWANHVDNVIMKAKDVGTIRSAQAPFVNAGKIIDDAADNVFSVGGRMVTNTNGLKDALIQGAANVVANPARRGVAAIMKPSTGLTLGASVSPVGQGIGRLAGRQALGRLPGSLAGAEVGQALGDEAYGNGRGIDDFAAGYASNPMNPEYAGVDPAMFGYPEDTTAEPAIGGYTKSQIENAMAAAIMDGNQQAFTQLQSLHSLLPQNQAANLSSTVASQVASSDNALSTIDQLEQLYNTAGGGSGKLGGTLQNALAGMGMSGDVQTYNDLSASTVSQLARALNGGGQVSDADAAVVIQALPKVTDSPEVAARKFAALKDRLQNAMQNTLTYSGGASPDPTASVY